MHSDMGRVGQAGDIDGLHYQVPESGRLHHLHTSPTVSLYLVFRLHVVNTASQFCLKVSSMAPYSNDVNILPVLCADLQQFCEHDLYAGVYDPQAYANLPVAKEIRDAFQLITRFTPQQLELPTVLKPFIPEYVPAIGDIDEFIKVPICAYCAYSCMAYPKRI